MRRIVPLVGLLIASLVLAACGDNNTGQDLQGKVWHLGALADTSPEFQYAVPADQQANYTITFHADNTFSATADCNQVLGAWATPRRNGLTITPGPSTMAYCGPDSLGELYIHLLSGAETYAIERDQLTISLSRAAKLTFVAGPEPVASAVASAAATGQATAAPTKEPTAKPTKEPTPKPTKEPTPKPTKEPTPKPTKEPTPKPTKAPTPAPTKTPKPSAAPSATPAPSNGLLGKTWQLASVDLVQPPYTGDIAADMQGKLTITFAEDGTFSAQADCNTVTGTYTTADPTATSGDLVITPSAGSIVGCPDGSLGDLYVIGLAKVDGYAISSNVLTATQTDGGSATFR